MTGILRWTTVLAAILLVLTLGTGILIAGTVAATGVVSVRVHESGPDGVHLYVPVPAVLVEAAITMAPLVVRLTGSGDVDRELARLRAEAGPWLPAVRSALAELDRLPDVTLVEVDGPAEHVSVRKHGRSLYVHAEEPGSRVSVVVPVRLVRRLETLLDI